MIANHRAFKVGVFVVVGLVLSTIVIFVIGDNRRAWERKVTYHAAYDDVVGLRPGSVVRMGGIDIGAVESVEHGDKADDNKVYVTFLIGRGESPRIRSATVATIEGKGLLGDKMVTIAYDKRLAEELRKSGRNPDALIPPDGWIPTVPPADPMGDAQNAAKSAKLALENIEKATKSIADERFKEDVQGTAHALREVLEGVAMRNGVAHRLIFDPEEANRVDRILGNLEQTSANLAAMTESVRDVAAHVKSGSGLAHAVIYDEQLAKGMTGTAVELHKSLEAVRTGKGVAHSLVYGDDGTARLMANVATMSDDLRSMVADIRAGRGTVGALLVDPTLYEDVKSLVGNIERSQVLRALVRYSIRASEDRPHAAPPADAKPVQEKGP